MPYLRFTRDARGFENTYLMHSFRVRGRSEPRVLYWFRTPPGVRVGRSPLDEDAIRTIEESNPNLKFDWKRILQSRPEPAPLEPRKRPEAGRRKTKPSRHPRRAAGSAGSPQAGGAVSRPQGATKAQPVAPELEAPRREVAGVIEPIEVSPVEDVVEEELVEGAEEGQTGAGRAGEAGAAGREEETLEPGVPDVPEPWADEEGLPVPELEEEVAPRQIRTLDPESHARLRARYAEILARISERTADPARQEELRAKADRLDPDAWVTAEEVREGLEHYEQVYSELRRALGRRRRRRRGRRRAKPPNSAPPAAG
ncbi:MAG: hypothetical protein HY654_03875 [Acidobacteria bacterium]|nr:hypothetical protein [Acidobacteriota bacterium]